MELICSKCGGTDIKITGYLLNPKTNECFFHHRCEKCGEFTKIKGRMVRKNDNEDRTDKTA